MNERKGVQKKFSRAVELGLPGSFYYKIADTGSLGGKKPWDALLLYAGKAFAIEFKKEGKLKTTDYQTFHLWKWEQNGGTSFIVNEKNMKAVLKEITKICRNQ